MYKVYDDIKDMLCDELEQISKKKELTSSSLDVIDKSIDIIKDIATIKAMEDSGYSNSYSNDYSNGYMPRYIYEGGNSYGRGAHAERDSQGRYSTEYERDHGRSYDYSGDTREEMRKLMERAKTDKEREAIRNAMNSL